MSGEGKGSKSKSKEGPMEGISELLRCYICMERLTNAIICPHCSKLCCFACMEHWVMDNHSNCPHCRNSLTLRDVIKIPLFDDLSEVLDTLHAVQKEVPTTSAGKEQEKCKIHHENESVYCETCKTCICHKCALFAEEHKGHSFKPLDALYQKHVETLQGELVKLQERMKIVFSQVHQVEKKIESVKLNKSKTKNEIKHVLEKMFHQLDLTAKERTLELDKFRHDLRKQAVEITKESHDLEKSITGGNVSALVEPNGDLKPEVSAAIKRLLTSSHDTESLPTSSFVNQVVPPYDSATFRMTSFSELKRKGDEVYSDPLEVQGLVWRLKVYPNGHRDEFGNYLAVFVELEKGYSTTANYQYCVEMPCLNSRSQRNRSGHSREYASDFADGESWGYRKFYELAHLEEDGFIRDDTLVLNFSVRPSTYYQKYQDQSHYLDKVVRERDALKQQLEAAKEQITTLKSDRKSLLSERSRASSSSRTAPSQHDSLTPSSLHSSQQHPAPHHRSSHHHNSQSTPHTAQHRRDKGARPDHEDSHSRGRYYSHGAPISQPHPPLHSHNSPKWSSQYPSGHAGVSQVHAEARVGPMGDAHSSSQIYPPGRRRSSEEAPGMWKDTTEPRRKSAEPLLNQHRDKDPKASKSPRQHKSSRDSRSRVNTVDSGSNEDLLSSQRWEHSTSTSDITIILPDGDKERATSASSSSTLIDSAEESPTEGGGGGGGVRRLTTAQRNQQHLSQEPFEEDEDHKDMLSLSTMEVGPTQLPLLSNYPYLHYESSSYFGEHQENYPPHHASKQDLVGLSQPTYPSPPKSRHGKSMTDLTGSNMSLTSSNQFLSQSIADFQHMQEYHSPRHVGDSRRMQERRFRQAYKKQPHMSSDSHLNHTPGLKSSVTSALSDLREEVEQKKARGKESSSSSHHIQRAASQQYHTHHSQHKATGKLNQRHLRATVVEENREPRGSPSSKRSTSKTKSSPDSKPKSESSSSSKHQHRKEEKPQSSTHAPPEQDTTDEEEASPEVDRHIDAIHSQTLGRSQLQASRPLGSMKSNSTSSLNNLSEIL